MSLQRRPRTSPRRIPVPAESRQIAASRSDVTAAREAASSSGVHELATHIGRRFGRGGFARSAGLRWSTSTSTASESALWMIVWM